VLDGIPLTDNRSPGFGPEIEVDPSTPRAFPRNTAERWAVVEINTLTDSKDGLHGQVVLSGGSFDTAGALPKFNTPGAKIS
jgi:hypothetical protein